MATQSTHRTNITGAESVAAVRPTGIVDVLLFLTSYPTPTTPAAVDKVVRLAQNSGAKVSALSFELNIRSPVGLYVDPLDVASIIAAERKKSSASAQELLRAFESIATRSGVRHDQRSELCKPAEVAGRLVDWARLRDLTFFPVNSQHEDQQYILEQLIFGSGRPVIVFPDEPERPFAGSFANIAIAWDFSRPAARAVGDALPFLRAATRVRAFTVADDKDIKTSSSGAALLEHLVAHDVQASFDDVRSEGRTIGEVLEAYVQRYNIDLLVMGAYGHSRLREFILGGATRSIICKPPTWVLLSR